MSKRFVLLTTLIAAAVACAAASLEAQAVAPPQAAFAKMTYTWSGEVVGTEGKTITVKVPFRDPVAGYVETKFKAGDKVVLTWALKEKGVADAVLYVETYEVMKASKVDVGYILPAEFVSADKAAKTLTVKIAVSDSSASTNAAPGRKIKVTTPMAQPDPDAKIGAIEGA